MSALEVLDRHGLLRESPAGAASSTYGFTHSVVRRSVYDNLSEPRRRLMHWRIVQMLEGDSNLPASPAEIEHHAALAGEAATAARASVAAGRYCLRVYANSEALAFARSGMRHSEALPERERMGLQIELMEMSLAARRPKDTEETAIRLEALAEQALSNGDVGACPAWLSPPELYPLGGWRLVGRKTPLAASGIRCTGSRYPRANRGDGGSCPMPGPSRT